MFERHLLFGLLALGLGGCPAEPELCTGGEDEDKDLQIDCADPDCAADVVACPLPACGDGDANGDEDCDGDDLRGRSCIELGAGDSGTLVCDRCRFDTSGCETAAANGLRAPGVEECDDGNSTAGDGCSPAMTLEDTTIITSSALNGQDASTATKSVFVPLLDEFDLNQDGTAETSLLFVVSTDRAEICDLVLDAGGLDGFLDDLFNGDLEGVYVLTMLQLPAGQPFAAGSATGQGPVLDDARPGITSVDAGFLVNAGGETLTNTSFGSNGTGSLTLESFAVTELDIDGELFASGNLSLSTSGIFQTLQFVPNPDAPTVINEPITVDINGAAACSFDFD